MNSGVTAIFSADIYLIPLAVGWRIVVDVSEEGWANDTEREEETHGEAEEECRGGEVDEDHAVLTGTRRPTLLSEGRTCKTHQGSQGLVTNSVIFYKRPRRASPL